MTLQTLRRELAADVKIDDPNLAAGLQDPFRVSIAANQSGIIVNEYENVTTSA